MQYVNEVEGGQSHLALVMGDLHAAAAAKKPVLVRMQTHCLAGGIFGSTQCDCRSTINASLKSIAEAGVGALIYLHHTQRGFGLDRSTEPNRMNFHRTTGRERGADAERPERNPEQRILREVGLGGQILSDLGICRIRLLTNYHTHVPALQGFGIEIAERVPVGDGVQHG